MKSNAAQGGQVGGRGSRYTSLHSLVQWSTAQINPASEGIRVFDGYHPGLNSSPTAQPLRYGEQIYLNTASLYQASHLQAV